MKKYTAVKLLTVIVSLLCLYNLSFTFVSQRIQKQAIEATRGPGGEVNHEKKQAYLDSLWQRPAFNVLGMVHTYKEVKEHELNLGLDLQGGIYMVLEISPIEIIKALSGQSRDVNFNKALELAQQNQQKSSKPFLTLFQEAFEELEPQGRLSRVFSTNANKNRINGNSTNEQVISVINQEIEGAVERSYEIIQSRIDKFGTTSPNIQRISGTGRIQVELPGVDNPARVRKLLSGIAKLEFVEIWENTELQPHLLQLNDYLTKHASDPAIAAIAKRAGIEQTTKANSTLPAELTSDSTDLAAQLGTSADSTGGKTDSLANQPNTLFSKLFAITASGLGSKEADTAAVNRLLALPQIRTLFPSNLRFVWDVKAESGNSNEQYLSLYAIKQKRGANASLNGDVITDARMEFGQTGKPEVSMQMNSIGAKKWKRLTGENINRRIAIVLDDRVYSAPVVQNEIPTGSSSISGNFTIDEAKDLANILKAGKLPAPTRIVEEAVVGPSLGQEAINQGLLSMLAGLALIVALMMAYYGSGGALANVALLANVFFNIGVLAQFQAALTLPGIAGIVLTIGMSVDANVLIFERIREELRNGLGKIEAIKLGFEKAFSSILDANITTFIIGAVLYVYGSGPVKGFAITLMIGIACSLFTSVFITRILTEWLARKQQAKLLSFETGLSRNLFRNLHFDFVGKRKIAYIFSSSIIILGLVSILLQGGLNLGVDFSGGRSYVVRFAEALPATEVRNTLSNAFGGAGTEVKTFGSNNQLKITTSYLIGDESASADAKVEQALQAGLAKYENMDPQVMSSTKVGATVADDIVKTSQVSILLSLVLIFLYILVRFRKWQYSLGAIMALFHDALFVLSAYVIARWFGVMFEIDQIFVASILTIIGYSINDTVVIFDRIREFSGLEMRSKKELGTIVNEGINATLSRSIMTSVTVLLVVVILLIFGGEVLRGFSFAMLIGVLAGSYSTIFIAAPVVIDLGAKHSEPEAPIVQRKAKAIN